MESGLYWLFFAGMTFIVAVILFVILVIFSIIAKYDPDDKGIVTFLAIFILVSSPASFYSLSWMGLTPPKDSITAYEVSQKSKDLNDRLGSLNKLIETPEELRLSELPEITEKIITIAKDVQLQSEEQSEIIGKLRLDIETERQKANEARELIDTLQSLTNEQLNAVKWLITEDAKEETKKAFYSNLILSFILGVFASLLASVIYRKFGSRFALKATKNIQDNIEGSHN
ncbi:hypothetical protein RII68_001852 [Vibrio parahaemolyticus]|uniref:hypothetical protein n=1 Tax=Vibrio parahaemolyticus TaxID=670 RepID=UPI0007A0C7FE|nr:hypothetical protein [Vibrio parahaemolyticus]EGR1765261.1 hypothetical protein [Vibrio parahaemolyticus]EIO3966916.1 hypothetical protein [Vibrio parahaemolyticus]EIO3989783.1 hypothetical protein [Vibrio parahaemolyticus]ELA9842201.1 hypothetical protein [Vibrio parahaemolyticus]ELC0705473.1 hypothetical protein [Vibrio parahaemolyticus]